MKQAFIYIMLFVAPFIFTSCGDDDVLEDKANDYYLVEVYNGREENLLSASCDANIIGSKVRYQSEGESTQYYLDWNYDSTSDGTQDFNGLKNRIYPEGDKLCVYTFPTGKDFSFSTNIEFCDLCKSFDITLQNNSKFTKATINGSEVEVKDCGNYSNGTHSKDHQYVIRLIIPIDEAE